ncbi:hypothetical protein BJ138DRAFT_1106572 [Hygrophoropsis aurantiaca]|uniref:Uncharacterized protein n=1 Tax=Hygrophoropsis aurantiaca TaxID=72124 RepID=A0ACB7ZU52_9AGAM|nr:hypothetical protein BJ138DRAFT_1106572 [Hygrophoropsis aurantiaca]
MCFSRLFLNLLLVLAVAQRLEAARAKRTAEILAMSADDREQVEHMVSDLGMEVENIPYTAPFGDEGFDLSNEGGEHEIYEGLAQQIADLTGFVSRRVDPRVRRDRIEIQTQHWDLQIDRLVTAYLDYRARDAGDGMPSISELEDTQDSNECPALAHIELVDIFSRRQESLSSRPSHVFPNETLIYHGFLGSSPLHPTVAISIRTLANYRQVHRTCPRLSIEAQCKALCHLHNSTNQRQMPYRPYLSSQFSAAYDIYLEIIYRVDGQIKAALHHDTPNWRLLNACPPCFYQLKDEPELDIAYLVTMDGNNSLKRWGSWLYGGTPRSDSRKPRSDYWLSPEAVDRFKDEVTSKPRIPNSNDVPLDDWEDSDSTTDSPMFDCVKRWRNAGPEQRKKVFQVYDESGVFIAACRHRFVLVACDMIRSGELAKYPLAVVNELLTVYGKDGGCAYDIGCAFAKTLSNSSLGQRARASNFKMMVGAFHGHAHNRKCQLEWHPTYIKGTGHSEGEGCEHIFSSSNNLAPGTRHASSFHRHQAMEEHFAFWDADKYASLSNFLRNHYREALTAIRTLETELATIKATYNLSDDDFLTFFAQEKIYLNGLQQPPVKDRLNVRYVEILDELGRCRTEWDLAREAANNALNTAPIGSGFDQVHAMLLQTRKRVDTAYAKLQNAEGFASHMELQLGIEKRWEIGCPEYNKYKDEASLCSYRAALDELERLVVMRLFELSKLSLSGTGYKLRQQIGKALHRRSQAIRNAISRYNAQAVAVNPPRPMISWKEIADYTFLGEFDLLRQSRSDVRHEGWTKPAQREATVKFFKLQRAREEIARLNIEIRRLRTAIHDENIATTAAIADLLKTNPPLALELKRQWQTRVGVNAMHLYRLDQIECLPGFCGTRGIGIRDGAIQSIPESSDVSAPGAGDDGANGLHGTLEEVRQVISTEYTDADVLEHEEHNREMENVADFMDSIDD